MNYGRVRKSGLLSICIIAAAGLSSRLHSTEIDSPDNLFSLSRDLDRLELRVQAVASLRKRELKNTAANGLTRAAILGLARKNYKTGYYSSARIFFRWYIQNSIPGPSLIKTEIWKKLYFSSYKLGDVEKTEAYLCRYISGFMDNDRKNYERFIAVLRSAAVAREKIFFDKMSLKGLASALKTIDFPKIYRYRILYFMALILRKEGLKVLAARWLQDIRKNAPSGQLIAKASFYLGIIRISQGKLNKSLLLFKNIVRQFPNHWLADYAQQALARVLHQMGRSEMALVRYRRIKKNSKVYWSSLPEMALISAKSGKWEDALDYADKYLEGRVHDPLIAWQLKDMIPYFLFQSGKTKESEGILNAYIKNQSRLPRDLKPPDPSLKDFYAQAAYLEKISQTKEAHLLHSNKLFRRIKNISDKIQAMARQQHKMRRSLSWSADFYGQIMPWHTDGKLHEDYLQTLNLNNLALDLGARINDIEAQKYKKQLNSEQHSMAYFRQKIGNSAIPAAGKWPVENSFKTMEDAFKNLTKRRNNLELKVLSIKASLAALMWQEHKKPFDHNSSQKTKPWSLFEEKIMLLEKKIMRWSDDYNTDIIRGKKSYMMSHPKKNFIARKTSVLLKENNILEKYRKKIRPDEFDNLHIRWVNTINLIHNRLQQIESRISGYSEEFLRSFTRMKIKYKQQHGIYLQIKKEYEENFSSLVRVVLKQVIRDINHRQSKYYKWIADGKWASLAEIKAKYHADSESIKSRNDMIDAGFKVIKKEITELWTEPLPY